MLFSTALFSQGWDRFYPNDSARLWKIVELNDGQLVTAGTICGLVYLQNSNPGRALGNRKNHRVLMIKMNKLGLMTKQILQLLVIVFDRTPLQKQVF